MKENNQNKEPLNKDFKVPKLRFKEFVKEWENIKLKDISARIKRKNKDNLPLVPLTISAQKGLINQYDYFDKQIASLNLSNYYIIQNGEFAYNKSYSNGYPYGAIKRLDYFEQGALSSLYICFSISNINSDYLVKYFDSGKWNKQVKLISGEGARNHGLLKQVKLISGEGARNHGLLNLSPDDFFNINIMISPSEEEQTKIAHFLNLINSKIKYMDGKIEALKKYKEGLVNLCFCDGKRYKVSSFVKQVEKRNKDNQILTVYSISNKKGFISQTEQFDGNEVASTNKANYKIVHKNEFAYNPARINVGSIAYLEEEIGQISPMYIVFSIHGISNILLDEYFHSIYFKKELRKHLEGSVRQSLSFENLCDFNINISNFSESFGLIFKSLNCKLSLLEKMLSDLKKIKSYLLENMFI